MGEPVQHSAGAVGRQFYVTHCTTADSVLNNPGYTVRAASPGDESLLQAAFHYPPYELPIEMWRDLPPVELTPRRLARTEDGARGVWVVHSSYLAKDTAGRDRSYFSHLLLLPDADPGAVLKSWDAAGWVRGYPPGAPKELRRDDARLPPGTLVNEENLTKFLNDDPPGGTELCSTVCPARLRGRPASERRELLARALHALLLVGAEEDDDRRRLYLHAEPGLVALLLFGAVRLLPEQAAGDLTFSTFEPYHRNIREYKLATVVGTWLGNTEKGLDSDLGTSRGVALDTVKAACSSAELRKPLPDGVAALVELAARGEWHLLPTVRAAMGEKGAGVAKAGKALARARGLARVDSGEAGVDELLALQEDAVAAEELKLRAQKVWPRVKAAALDPARGDVRKAFGELLAEPSHVEELWAEGFAALLKEDFRTWDSRWSVIRAAAPAEGRKLLHKSIGGKAHEDKLLRLVTDVRARLRAACAEAGWAPPRPLLVPIGVGELEPLLAGPPACAGATACAVLAKDEMGLMKHAPAPDVKKMRARAKEFLLSAPAAAVAAYVKAAREYLDTDPHFLEVLFHPHTPKAAALMDRLLAAGVLEPGDWRKLIEAARLMQDAWGDFLLEKDRLANLLVNLGGDGVGADIWDVYLGLLTPALVAPEAVEGDNLEAVHLWERRVHANLRAAAERLTRAEVKLVAALPPGGVARLAAANSLVKWVEEPAAAERDGYDEVTHACAVFELEPHFLVASAYKMGGFRKGHPGAQPDAFAPLVSLFRTCFPVDGHFNTARRAATEAVRLSHQAPPQVRGPLQSLLIQSSVPEAHYPALLTADWREPLDPFTVAELGRAAKGGAKKAGPKYVPPSGAKAQEAVPVADAPFEDEEAEEPEPVIEKKRGKGRSAARASGGGRYARKRGRSDGNMKTVMIVVVLGALTLALIAGAIVMMKGSGGKPAPETKQK